MKVNVLIDRGEAFHVDTLDLYSVRARSGFMTQAARELNVTEDVIRHDLGRVLRKLEELQEKQIEKTLQPAEKPAMPAEEQQEALALLKDPHLLDRLLADFNALWRSRRRSQQAHRLFSRHLQETRCAVGGDGAVEFGGR